MFAGDLPALEKAKGKFHTFWGLCFPAGIRYADESSVRGAHYLFAAVIRGSNRLISKKVWQIL